MNNISFKIHYFQTELIKKLSLNSGLKFNDLIIKGLESEHMNYHLKRLIEIGFVKKINSKYELTDIGKDYSNLMDEESSLVEKQPKTSIIIHAKRRNKKGQIEHLLTKRLRQPYFGKVGHLTGKVRFGETLLEAAKRELFEETGLSANSYNLERVYRKMRKRKNEWVQDVIFYIFLVKELKGKLIKKTKYQESFWITKDKIEISSLDTYDDFTLDDHLKAKPLTFSENIGDAKGY